MAAKPSVVVRASVNKNHNQACLPLHPALVNDLLAFRREKVSAGILMFGGLVPKSKTFRFHLAAAGISKRDSHGKVVDVHSFRHTFCTNLHLAGMPLRCAVDDEHLRRLVSLRAASGD
jgi:hypothetical protein